MGPSGYKEHAHRRDATCRDESGRDNGGQSVSEFESLVVTIYVCMYPRLVLACLGQHFDLIGEMFRLSNGERECGTVGMEEYYSP